MKHSLNLLNFSDLKLKEMGFCVFLIFLAYFQIYKVSLLCFVFLSLSLHSSQVPKCLRGFVAQINLFLTLLTHKGEQQVHTAL